MSDKRKMNKVGIVTLYHENYNFGGLLQAYALPLAINTYFDKKAEQIDYIQAKMLNGIDKKNEKQSFANRLYGIIYRRGIEFFTIINKKHLLNRKKVFDTFIEEIPHSDKTYDNHTILGCLDQYETLICGGDQIWNDFGCDENIKVYTLQFVPDKVRKISYAPSMAILETTERFEEIMKEAMEHLDAISIREKQSLSFFQSITNRKIEVVVDPVLLLEKKDWEKELRDNHIKKKYILCYLLGDNETQRKSVHRLSKKIKLPVVTFPHIVLNVVRKCDLFFGDIQDYTSGPREFIGLIKNAEFVITDSFHACVFAMIFQKPFVVFERNKIGEKDNMNGRIYDFLEEYHLEDQLVTEKEFENMKGIPEIDFTYAHKQWEKRRKESLEYLGNALKDN